MSLFSKRARPLAALYIFSVPVYLAYLHMGREIESGHDPILCLLNYNTSVVAGYSCLQSGRICFCF
jgi:hypothetical protein